MIAHLIPRASLEVGIAPEPLAPALLRLPRCLPLLRCKKPRQVNSTYSPAPPLLATSDPPAPSAPTPPVSISPEP
jgi:hypothetical protein